MVMDKCNLLLAIVSKQYTRTEKPNNFLNNTVKHIKQIEINWHTLFEKQVKLFREVLFPIRAISLKYFLVIFFRPCWIELSWRGIAYMKFIVAVAILNDVCQAHILRCCWIVWFTYRTTLLSTCSLNSIPTYTYSTYGLFYICLQSLLYLFSESCKTFLKFE